MIERARRVVLLGNLLFSFSLAITAYTNSSFIEKTTGPQLVGVLYAVAAICSIVLLSRATHFIGTRGNRAYFALFALIQIISLIVLVSPVGTVLHISAFITYLFSSNILLFSMDVFFHHTADHKARGKARGLYLLLGNIGWIFAPILGALLIERFNYEGTYIFVLGLIVLVASIVLSGLRKVERLRHTPHIFHRPLRTAFKDRTLRRTILANFILQFFYSWMVVYTPIYLSFYLGLSWKTIGIIFAVMLSAFVILDYPLGRLADKIGSEKELASIGFVIMTLAVFGLAFLPLGNVILIGALLFFSRVGAATVETMTEIHFFKIAENADPRVLSVFRDLRPLAYIIGPLLGTIILEVAPFRSIFAILGVVLIVGFFVALGLEKNPEWWTRAHKD